MNTFCQFFDTIMPMRCSGIHFKTPMKQFVMQQQHHRQQNNNKRICIIRLRNLRIGNRLFELSCTFANVRNKASDVRQTYVWSNNDSIWFPSLSNKNNHFIIIKKLKESINFALCAWFSRYLRWKHKLNYQKAFMTWYAQRNLFTWWYCNTVILTAQYKWIVYI